MVLAYTEKKVCIALYIIAFGHLQTLWIAMGFDISHGLYHNSMMGVASGGPRRSAGQKTTLHDSEIPHHGESTMVGISGIVLARSTPADMLRLREMLNFLAVR